MSKTMNTAISAFYALAADCSYKLRQEHDPAAPRSVALTKAKRPGVTRARLRKDLQLDNRRSDGAGRQGKRT